MKIALVVSQYNENIAQRLLDGAKRCFAEKAVMQSEYDIFRVPGAFEIPFFSQKLVDAKTYDGLIALGCVIKGETDHYTAICNGVTYGIQKISIENRIPVLFGVLMCPKMDQALARSDTTPKNKGYECALSLLKMLGRSL